MKLTIRLKLIISFTALAVVVSTSGAILSYISSSKILMEEMENKLQANAYRLADSYNAWVESQLKQLETLSENIIFEFEEPLYTKLSLEAKRLGFNTIGPTDTDGFLHLFDGKNCRFK